MIGDGAPQGTCSDRSVGHGLAHLVPGKGCRVTSPFRDFDGQEHPAGEATTYVGAAFLPYDDGRSILISVDGEHAWRIRMHDRDAEQREILDHPRDYLNAA